MPNYVIGDVARLSVTFTDIAGNPTDPSTVSLQVVDPIGVETIYSVGIVHDSTGNFHFDLSLLTSGTYNYLWIGSGSLVASQPGSVYVAPSTINPGLPSPPNLDLCTLEQVKGWLNTLSDTSNDVLISRLITSASYYIMRRTGTISSSGSIPTASTLNSQVAFNEWYDGNGNERLFLRFFPVVSISSLSINGITIPASTGYTSPGYVIDQNGRSVVLRSSTPYLGGRMGTGSFYVRNFGPIYSFCSGIQNINIQYTAGYTSTPLDLNDACIQMVGYTFRSGGWIGQQQVAQAENVGTITYVKWTIPPMAEDVIQKYTRAAIV